MPNAWIEHIRAFSKRNDITYSCAVGDARCKEEYYKQKSRNAKKTRTPAKEAEGMGAEDVNVAEKMSVKSKTPKASKQVIDNFDLLKNISGFVRKPAKAKETKAKRIKKIMNLTSSNRFWEGGKDYYYPSVIEKKNNTAYGIVDGAVMNIGKVFENDYYEHRLGEHDEPKPVASNLRFYSAGKGILSQGRGEPIEVLNKLQAEGK